MADKMITESGSRSPVPAPDLPANDAGHDGGDRHTEPVARDVLRRIPDLLIGDLIAFRGSVRTVHACGPVKISPTEAFLVLEPTDFEPVDETTGKPHAYRFGTETRVRVLHSHWEAPRG